MIYKLPGNFNPYFYNHDRTTRYCFYCRVPRYSF